MASARENQDKAEAQAQKDQEKAQEQAAKVNTDGPEAIVKTSGTPDPENPAKPLGGLQAGPPMVKVTLSQHMSLDASGRTAGVGGHPPFTAKLPYEEIITDEATATAYLRAGCLLLDPDDPTSAQKIADSRV